MLSWQKCHVFYLYSPDLAVNNPHRLKTIKTCLKLLIKSLTLGKCVSQWSVNTVIDVYKN